VLIFELHGERLEADCTPAATLVGEHGAYALQWRELSDETMGEDDGWQDTKRLRGSIRAPVFLPPRCLPTPTACISS